MVVCLFHRGITFGFMWLFDSWSFTDCLLFGAIISATDPGNFVSHATLCALDNKLYLFPDHVIERASDVLYRCHLVPRHTLI